MILACGACGEKMGVEPEVVDGQHIECPFCGETAIFNV